MALGSVAGTIAGGLLLVSSDGILIPALVIPLVLSAGRGWRNDHR